MSNAAPTTATLPVDRAAGNVPAAFTVADVRAMEAYVAWRELMSMATKSLRLSAKDAAALRRGIALERAGVHLVAADDPAGQYDSPRVLDINCELLGRNEWLALRRAAPSPAPATAGATAGQGEGAG